MFGAMRRLKQLFQFSLVFGLGAGAGGRVWGTRASQKGCGRGEADNKGGEASTFPSVHCRSFYVWPWKNAASGGKELDPQAII